MSAWTLDDAAAAFRRFHWDDEPREVFEVDGEPHLAGMNLAALGSLVEVRIVDLETGEPAEHRFREPFPLLAHDERDELFVVDGPSSWAHGPAALTAVVYRTHKGGELCDWDHDFGEPLPMIVFFDGHLAVLGGSYRITAAGIVH